jgi:hypothetical protein
MTVVTPFTQGKVMQGMSNISYRVGGVFAEAADPAQHVSMTFVCREGGQLSILLVHARVPRQRDRQTATISAQVDDQASLRIAASRKTGDGLTAYTIDNASDAIPLAKAWGTGKKLWLELEEHVYDIPLQGLEAALARLAAVCPYG